MAQRDLRERKQVKLSDLTDDQLLEFMDSVETDEEADFSSDDELDDPTFNVQDHEISPEDEQCISQSLETMQESDAFIAEAVNYSLNISKIDTPSASSTLNQAQAVEIVELDVVEETASLLEEACVVAAVPSTSTAVQPGTSTPVFKASKRPRSPLPTMEVTGPMNVPSAGGFMGQGKCMNHTV